MRELALALLIAIGATPLIGAIPAWGTAGEISGRVFVMKGGQRTVASRAAVTVTCARVEPAVTFTNDNGIYRITGSAIHGSCGVQVRYQGKTSNRISLVIGGRTQASLLIEHAGQAWKLSRG